MNCLKEFCLVLLVAISVVSATDPNQKPYKVVCYIESSASYRKGDGKFIIEHIDPFLCTHLVYGYAKLRNNSIVADDPYLDLSENWGLGSFERFSYLKKKNPQLNTLIAIGGWGGNPTLYSRMAAVPSERANFVKSVVDFCKKYNFDGLSMDWEYPASEGGDPHDKENFVSLLQDLRAAFTPHGLLLSASVSARKEIIDAAYDIPKVSQYLDFINVMAFGFHEAWEKVTGHNAPLYARDDEPEPDKILNVDYAIKYWISKGADRKKIILGMGLFGRSFTLADAGNNGLGAKVKGRGKAGALINLPGTLGYNEICLYVKVRWTEVFVTKVEAPYAYHADRWVSYDNNESIGIKVNYLINEGLGGGMVWSLDTDDFRGKCFRQKYPLLTKIATKLNGDSVLQQTVPPEVQVTREPDDPGPLFKCKEDGYFRDKSDCSKFHYCIDQNHGYFARHIFYCGQFDAFDEITKTCTFRGNVSDC